MLSPLKKRQKGFSERRVFMKGHLSRQDEDNRFLGITLI